MNYCTFLKKYHLPNPINIAIAEDHNLFRTTLAKFIEDKTTNKIVISVPNGQDLLNKLEHISVDLILLDLNMPIMDGKKTLSIIRRKYGNAIKIIILSMYDDVLYMKKYMTSGANAYLSKGCSEGELLQAISILKRENYYFPPTVQELFKKELFSNSNYDHSVLVGEQLSEREIEICQLICKGFTCPQISRTLHLSHRTVENHKSRIFKKLNAKSCTEMMEKAIISGYYSLNI